MSNDQPINGEHPGPDDDVGDDTADRAQLEPLSAVLRGAAVWTEPPAGLATLVVEQIRAAGTAEEAPVAGAPESAPARMWRRVLPALAAAAVLAFGAGFLVADRDAGDPDAMADVALAGSELVPDASATGDVLDRGAGYAIRLQVVGLPPAPDGSYYEGYLRADDGEMVSVGTFHMRGGAGAVVLWSGVRIADYPTLVVTEQAERSTADSVERVVLEGPVELR